MAGLDEQSLDARQPHASTHESGGDDEVDLGSLPGVFDHGNLGGLADDDHTQYDNAARHDLLARHGLGTVVPHDNLNDLSEKNHSSLAGVTVDDHHAEDHAARHQNGGLDEVNVTGLNGELADAQTPKAHNLGGAEHGVDTLANLNTKISDGTVVDTGDARFSDDRDPNAHTVGGARHSADTLANMNAKISDGTLIDTGDGRLSDARTPTAHALGGAGHSADTLANLNLKVSDGTLIDTGDGRLSDARTPTSHAGSHKDGGTDELDVEELATAGAQGTIPVAQAGNAVAMSVLTPQISLYQAGDISVADDVTMHQAVPQAMTAIELFAVIKTAPTDANAIFEIEYNVGTGWVSVGTVTINDGAYTGTTGGLAVALAKDARLRLNVDQIGATVVGAGIGVHVRCRL